jgi:hypothetical protein
MISVLFDECCPFCKDEIILQIETGMDDVYQCDCGAAITVSFSGNLQLDCKKENEEFLEG